MKDWKDFTKTIQETAESTGKRPSVFSYIIIKSTDNALIIAVFLFTILFSYVGLFSIASNDQQKFNWALHAAELSLGVFLGLLKTGKNA